MGICSDLVVGCQDDVSQVVKANNHGYFASLDKKPVNKSNTQHRKMNPKWTDAGIVTVESCSHPGQSNYLVEATGKKYRTLEQARKSVELQWREAVSNCKSLSLSRREAMENI